MPQERENQSPVVTSEDWQAIKSQAPREVIAARVIMSNRVTGIPHRPYLTGQSDHAPVLQGVAAFCDKVWALVDMIDNGAHPDALDAAAADLKAHMEIPANL